MAVAALATGAVALAGGTWLALGTEQDPAPSSSPRVATPSDARTIWYSVETAREVLLLAAPLDGSAPPTVQATRPSGPWGTARAWHLGPTGDVALWVEGELEEATSVIEGVDLRSGRTAWQEDVAGYPDLSVWSADGRRWAASLRGRDGEQTGYLLVDTATGASTLVPTMEDAHPIGFTADDDLILGERLPEEVGAGSAWRFHRVVGATGGTAPLPAEALRESTISGAALEVSASRLTEVRTVAIPDGQVDRLVRVQLLDLVTGERRFVGPEEASDVTSVSFTPDGSRLLLDTVVRLGPDDSDHAITVLDLEGGGGEVWRGEALSDRTFAEDGRYVAATSWTGRPVITVLDLDTGRSAVVPLPANLVAASPRAIRGAGSVPVLAVAEPSATPSPSATPPPPLVPGAPMFAASWVEEGPAGRRLGRVSVLVPAQGGGAAVAASLEPMELGIEETIFAEPFPGTDDWLVRAGGWPGLRLWRWSPGHPPVELDLPPDVEAAGGDLAIHPDGGSLATLLYPPEGPTTLAVVDLEGAEPPWTLPLQPPYTYLAGWAGDGQRIVLSHHICTEGCEGRFASHAWLDTESGVVTAFGPADRDTRIPTRHALVGETGRELLLSEIQDETADDIVLEWQDGSAIGDVRQQRWSPDLADLYLETVDGDVSTMVVIRDAWAGGPGRHPVTPERIGALPPGLSVHELHPGERWVLAVDRANDLHLVDLESGSAAPLAVDLATGNARWDEGG